MAFPAHQMPGVSNTADLTVLLAGAFDRGAQSLSRVAQYDGKSGFAHIAMHSWNVDEAVFSFLQNGSMSVAPRLSSLRAIIRSNSVSTPPS